MQMQLTPIQPAIPELLGRRDYLMLVLIRFGDGGGGGGGQSHKCSSGCLVEISGQKTKMHSGMRLISHRLR